jgi:hypothetical protein
MKGGLLTRPLLFVRIRFSVFATLRTFASLRTLTPDKKKHGR